MACILKRVSKLTKKVTYRAQVFAGARADGTKRMVYRTFGTAKEAKTWARDQETARGKGQLLAEGRCTIGSLLDDLAEHNRTHHIAFGQLLIDVHLRPFFGTMLANQLTSAEIRRYIAARQAKGIKDPTINRELSTLRRAFRLGVEAEPPRVARVPRIPKLAESEPRQGFFEDAEYRALLRELTEELKPILMYGYFTGARKGEMLALTWPEVDLEARMVRLPGSKTKNGRPRTIPLVPDLAEALKLQKEIRDRYWPRCTFVFFRHATGERICDFRKGWELACKRAGLWDATAGKLDKDGEPQGKPTKLVHDLRCSAVRNLVRAGVSTHTAQRISGHLTDTVFRRYDIVAERDLADAAAKLDTYVESQQKSSTSGILGVADAQTAPAEIDRKRLN